MNFFVYLGKNKDSIDYVGTTIQEPEERFRWHKNNGKGHLKFEIYKKCQTKEEMLDLEYELIQKFNPKLNKIKHRKQNFNKKLTDEELKNRIGNKEWCQCCLKRRVNKGYKKCYFCS